MTRDRSSLRKSMDTLFPQQDAESCRVCNEPVVDGRWNYCSERCREIATAVQRMFVWDVIREEVLERDGYTCQQCGLSKTRWRRAYWQVRERIDERNPHDAGENHERWQEVDTRLRAAYDVGSPTDGGFHVDHICPIADGGHPFDEQNLQTLCKFCHRSKTASENRESDAESAPEITLSTYLETDS